MAEHFESYLSSNLDKIEKILAERLDRNRTPIGNKLKRYFAGGGRIRPRIMLAAGRLVGAKQAELNKLAASLEMLHTATLIHDDLIDGTVKRRGRRTLHRTAAPNVAVLGGDLLLAGSLSLAAGLGKAEIISIIADALARLCAGEIAETFGSPDYYRNIADKTGVLFEAACTLAGAAAGASVKQTRALKNFGLRLGIAYQMIDDVHDFREDLRGGIMTLPVMRYRAGGKAGRDAALAASVREAKALAGKAAGELDIFSATPARAFLQSLARGLGAGC